MFTKNTGGQGLLEYALILVLVAVVMIVILTLLGSQITNVFSNIVYELETNPPEPRSPAAVVAAIAVVTGILFAVLATIFVWLKRQPPEQEGQGLVEYALILVLVLTIVIVILMILTAIGNVFSNIISNI